VNWPSPRFVCLPVVFSLSEFIFSGTAVAMCNNGIGYFYFEAEDGEEGPLKALRINAHIGDSSQQVLKNLKKVEEFIVQQLKRKIVDSVVFPNFIKFPLVSQK
jgi:hypothetical protein